MSRQGWPPVGAVAMQIWRSLLVAACSQRNWVFHTCFLTEIRVLAQATQNFKALCKWHQIKWAVSLWYNTGIRNKHEDFPTGWSGQILTAQIAVSNSMYKEELETMSSECWDPVELYSHFQLLWVTLVAVQGHWKQIPPLSSDPGAEPDSLDLKFSARHAAGAFQVSRQSGWVQSRSPSLHPY